MSKIADLTSTPYSGDPRADALLDQPVPWNYYPDARTTLYYTFDSSPGSLLQQETTSAVSRFNASQIQGTRQALQYVSSVTGIALIEVSSSDQADIHFGNTNLAGSAVAGLTAWNYNYQYNPSNQEIMALTIDAKIYLDNVEWNRENASPTPGSRSYETLLHEIGHMLGLAHPFDSPRPLPAAQDNTNNSIMSYTKEGAPKSQFQPYDLLALEWLYGGDGLGGQHGLNSTHGPSLHSTPTHAITGSAGPDRLHSSSANENFDGLGGVDTLVLQGPRSDYHLTPQNTGWLLQDQRNARDGSDTLRNIERLQFSSDALALDLEGSAGSTARMLGALLGAQSLGNKELVGIVLQAIDQGMSSTQLANIGLDAILGPSHSHADTVTLLHFNLLHTAPSSNSLQTIRAGLDNGSYTEAELVLWVSDSEINAANIDLVGLQQTGLVYI